MPNKGFKMTPAQKRNISKGTKKGFARQRRLKTGRYAGVKNPGPPRRRRRMPRRKAENAKRFKFCPWCGEEL